MNQQKTIFTVGHSTHSAVEFLHILQAYHIEQLVDVRRFPGSRKFPWFNQEVLKSNLNENGISYVHLKSLGGRRKPNSESENTEWRHPAFRAYADFMESEEFKTGIQELELLATEKVTCIMCSEVLWWRCHRSMISDYLKANNWEVLHILSKEKSSEHPFTQPAKVVNGALTYH